MPETKFGFEQWGVHYISPDGLEQVWVPRERVTKEELLREYVPGLVQEMQDIYLVRRWCTAWEKVDV